MFKFLFIVVALINTLHAETISQRKMEIVFFGQYYSNLKTIFNWLTPEKASKVGAIFNNQNGQQTLLSREIASVEVELYNSNYDDPKSVIVSFFLNQTDYLHNRWTSSNATVFVKPFLNGQSIMEPIECRGVVIDLHHNFNAASQARLYAFSERKPIQMCEFEFATRSMNYRTPKSMSIPFFVLEMVIVLIQLICAFFIFKWNHSQELSLSRFSLMGFSACFVSTSYRIWQQISYMASDKKVYAGILLVLTSLLLIFMFSICRKMASIRLFRSPFFHKCYYFGLLISFAGYAYLFLWFPVQIWAVLLAPSIFFVFQSHRNFKLRGTVSRICYSYYLGIFGIQMIEPLYMFACPKNIYLLKQQIIKSIILVGVYIVGSIIFAVQFNFFFKSAQPRRSTFLISASTNQIIFPQIQAGGRERIIGEQPQIRGSMHFQMGAQMEIPECSICLCELSQNVQSDHVILNTSIARRNQLQQSLRNQQIALRTRCGHFYHKVCILQWMKHRKDCPNCRREIKRQQFSNVHFD